MDAAPHDPFAAIRLSNYRHYATAFLCSSLALQMMGTTLGWELYERTRDPLVLGLVGVARAFPVVIMALPAGQVIDSFRRQRVMSLTQACFAVVLVALTWASHAGASVGAVLMLVACMGFVRTFNGPARASLLPDIVPANVFQNAVTWNVGLFQCSAVVGPLAAGVLIDRFRDGTSAWVVYAISAALCAISSVLASRIVPLREQTPGGLTLSGLWTGIGAGLRHVRDEKLILSTITLDLFAVLLGGATGLLPVFAQDILHVGPIGLGWLRAAPFLGALVMSLLLAWKPIRRGAGMKLLLSVAGFGVATIVFGYSEWFWLSMASLFVAGAVDNVSVVIRHVLVQTRTPAQLRGRVSAVNSVFIESSNELGAFESGAVARLFGPVFSVVSGGAGTILVVLGVALAWKQIRTLDRLDDAGTRA